MSKREIDLEKISDGRLYVAGDMVKIGCNDCAGCSECCRTVGDTIILDPYDLYQLEQVSGLGFEELMQEKIELRVVDGMIQPNLKMRADGKGCAFLSDEGRCTIHNHRPGFCRMFPMGRIYQDEGFKYFLQVHECNYPNKTKIKLKKWLGIPELSKYETYINDWHQFLKKAQAIIEGTENDTIIKNLNMYVLNLFYVKRYETQKEEGEAADFYGQFYGRLTEALETVKLYG